MGLTFCSFQVTYIFREEHNKLKVFHLKCYMVLTELCLHMNSPLSAQCPCCETHQIHWNFGHKFDRIQKIRNNWSQIQLLDITVRSGQASATSWMKFNMSRVAICENATKLSHATSKPTVHLTRAEIQPNWLLQIVQGSTKIKQDWLKPR